MSGFRVGGRVRYGREMGMEMVMVVVVVEERLKDCFERGDDVGEGDF